MEDIRDKSIVVIILNYLNYLETIVCVQSILDQNYSNYNIIIVDNGSNNNSFYYLYKEYKDNRKVTVIKTGRNYGFAKGNNIGICYAKEKFDAEYIMLLNSDTIMDDREYINKMIEADAKGVGVIGSKIIGSDKKETYWMRRYVTFPATLINYLRIMSRCKGKIFYQTFFERLLERCKSTNIVEGSVLLLTPAYFQYYNYLDSRTFLYCEEELLYLRCKKKGLEMRLNDNTYLYHKYGQSSQVLHANDNQIFYKLLKSSYKFVVWESIKMLFFIIDFKA